jgi:LuxR family transcriptional regulator, maltose regulon positive regulatory protein
MLTSLYLDDNFYANLLSVLTMQEYKVLQLAKHGAANKEIASQFNISTETVRKHRKNIMRKIGVTGKTEMAKFLILLSKYEFIPPKHP